MVSESSLPHSQTRAACSYPEPDRMNPHPTSCISFLSHFLYIIFIPLLVYPFYPTSYMSFLSHFLYIIFIPLLTYPFYPISYISVLSHFLYILYNIIFPPAHRSPKWSISITSPQQNLVCTPHVHHTCYIPLSISFFFIWISEQDLVWSKHYSRTVLAECQHSSAVPFSLFTYLVTDKPHSYRNISFEVTHHSAGVDTDICRSRSYVLTLASLPFLLAPNKPTQSTKVTTDSNPPNSRQEIRRLTTWQSEEKSLC